MKYYECAKPHHCRFASKHCLKCVSAECVLVLDFIIRLRPVCLRACVSAVCYLLRKLVEVKREKCFCHHRQYIFSLCTFTHVTVFSLQLLSLAWSCSVGGSWRVNNVAVLISSQHSPLFKRFEQNVCVWTRCWEPEWTFQTVITEMTFFFFFFLIIKAGELFSLRQEKCFFLTCPLTHSGWPALSLKP